MPVSDDIFVLLGLLGYYLLCRHSLLLLRRQLQWRDDAELVTRVNDVECYWVVLIPERSEI